MGELRMPSLGADMDAGTVVAWQVAPGARVARGDVVVLVETQKGVVEVEIWESGVIDRLLVEPGAKVPVGTVLATVHDGDGSLAAREPLAPTAKTSPSTAPSRAAPSPSTTARGPAEPASRVAPLAAPASRVAPLAAPAPVRASPAARQRARERGIDLATVHGTGPRGAVTRDDVESAGPPPVASPPVSPPPVASPPVSPPSPPISPPSPPVSPPPASSASDAMRRAIAGAMARSKREIPHYYLSTEIDVLRAVAWLESENARRGVSERLLLAPLLLKAAALALREVPELNGFFVDGSFRRSEAIHLGVAIALRQGGLVAPAIHDVDRRPLGELMATLRELVARARAGVLKSSELTDPTVTVTSLGEQGADAVFGVIYPPQVALVGFGSVRERAWAEGGLVGARPVIVASLSADHRVSDGHRGARFLAAVARRLSDPEKL
jgi:pyruvate dehydrogenase E2 component (dihydrolipoamide acetyltransferase)